MSGLSFDGPTVAYPHERHLMMKYAFLSLSGLLSSCSVALIFWLWHCEQAIVYLCSAGPVCRM